MASWIRTIGEDCCKEGVQFKKHDEFGAEYKEADKRGESVMGKGVQMEVRTISIWDQEEPDPKVCGVFSA